MTQKFNCEKCMKDLHDECADPESCLCAETHNKAPTLEQLATEQINKISIKDLKESAKEGRLSTTIQQNKKQIHIQILNHDIQRLRPQCQIDGIYYFRVDLPVEKTIIQERENEKICCETRHKHRQNYRHTITILCLIFETVMAYYNLSGIFTLSQIKN